MSRGIKKWTEAAIARLQKEGRGQGRLATYSPWVQVGDFYSEGRTHEPYSHLTRRNHHLLSDAEYHTFVFLEWERTNTDIREQYPLDRDITLELAKEIGVRHPYYPSTHVPHVMTLDFLVTGLSNGKEVFKAYSTKVLNDLNKPEVVERLEIERATCEGMGISYDIIVKERIPQTKLRNLIWVRDAQLDELATEPYQGFYDEHMARMTQDLSRARCDERMVDYCAGYDRRYSVESGTAIRIARMLMASRTLSFDLNNPEPQLAPVSSFQVHAMSGRLRSVGGA